jgi:hypothetical protein
MKKIFRIIPLIYFAFMAIFWFLENYMATGNINYIALLALLVFLIELFYNHKIAGLITGGVMVLFSGYRLLAMLLDIVKGGGLNPNMAGFIAFGSILFGLGVLMSVLLIMYHAKQIAKVSKEKTTSV